MVRKKRIKEKENKEEDEEKEEEKKVKNNQEKNISKEGRKKRRKRRSQRTPYEAALVYFETQTAIIRGTHLKYTPTARYRGRHFNKSIHCNSQIAMGR